MYIEQTGEGQDLFLLHGWRMNLNCWKPLIDRLTEQCKRPCRITLIDLPGHGRSIGCRHSLARPETLAEHLLDIAPPDAIWIGWSLGGLLAQMAITHKDSRIPAFVSIGMGCKYAAAPDWQHGVETKYLINMDKQLTHDPTHCIDQFIEFQTSHIEHKAQTQTALKRLCAVPCELEELQAGLKLLETADLREAMKRWNGDALFIAGEHDAIYSPAAAEQSAKLCRHSRYVALSGAGHAPLLSHPEATAQVIDAFCQQPSRRP